MNVINLMDFIARICGKFVMFRYELPDRTADSNLLSNNTKIKFQREHSVLSGNRLCNLPE
jgi:hypothetical protein